MKIAIIVVTYNRKKLLEETIEAILKQSYKDFELLLIDNNSTDGTYDYIKKYLDNNELIKYYNTGENLGGAGGFSYGLRIASEEKFDYAYIMDDDTILTENALMSLKKKINVLEGKFGFINSLVKWRDGSLCEMNLPIISEKILRNYTYLKDGLLQCDSCSFVACLVNIRVMREIGLPIKEFFIYGDDVEFTTRLSTVLPGYIDFDSTVIHKIPENKRADVVTISSDRINRYFYDTRNSFYIAKRKGKKYILKYMVHIMWTIIRIVNKSHDKKIKRIGVVMKGFFAGINFNPKIEMVNDSESENK